MGASTSNDEGAIASINVAPLVDVTLVLLIVFMVTAQAMASRVVPMDLPSAKTASNAKASAPLVVSIDDRGAITVDGKALATDEALRREALAAKSRDPAVSAVVRAPKVASHGRVITVLDELRHAGITHVAFAAEKKP